MSRYLVLVEIDADTPLNAESRVGIALEVVRCQGRPFVRQTGVQVEPLPEVAEPHDALTCTDSSHEDCFVAQMEEPQSERRVRLNQVLPEPGEKPTDTCGKCGAAFTLLLGDGAREGRCKDHARSAVGGGL